MVLAWSWPIWSWTNFGSQPSSIKCVAYERRSECISSPVDNSRSLQYRRNRRSSVFSATSAPRSLGNKSSPLSRHGLPCASQSVMTSPVHPKTVRTPRRLPARTVQRRYRRAHARRANVCCTVLCASDPYAVVGVREAFKIEPDIVTGPTANTQAGIDLVRKLTGLEALNLLDLDSIPRLLEILKRRLPFA